MATKTVVINDGWGLIVQPGDNFLLTSAINAAIEVATTEDGNVPPDIAVGHQINTTDGDGISRSVLGPGAVFARCTGASGVLAALSAWTP
jgi:hypothetical protein